MVDIRHMEATQSTHHHLKRLAGDVLHTVEVLGEALHTQKHMNPIVRESASDRQQLVAQSTESLGKADQPNIQEHFTTMKADRPNFNLMVRKLNVNRNPAVIMIRSAKA